MRARAYIYIRAYIHVYMCVCAYICIRTHICAHAYIHACVCVRVRVCARLRAHMHIYMHVYTHAHICAYNAHICAQDQPASIPSARSQNKLILNSNEVNSPRQIPKYSPEDKSLHLHVTAAAPLAPRSPKRSIFKPKKIAKKIFKKNRAIYKRVGFRPANL